MNSMNLTFQAERGYVTLTNNEYSNSELNIFSFFLNLFSICGILFHSLVLIVLILHQIKSRFYSNRFRKQQNSALRTNSKSNQNFKNYVTFAFVMHQILIDLLRLVYALFYSNSLLLDSKKYLSTVGKTANEIIIVNASQYSLAMHAIYERYCSQMALLYSILTMVTIINILTILISETCRFYDLKLSSSDTSSISCIMFGVALIWISSMIVISSLMLVGIADSAAPTYKCNLNESESPTRSIVINIVWFLLVTFVIVIACSYSMSLYKELTSFNYHHRLSLFAPNIFTISEKPDSKFLSRHVHIVDETTKRLNIFVFLIGVFCFTFLPNFIMTILKNVVDTNQITLKPYNLIASIINLINPTFNSIVLLTLACKSNDSILVKQLSFDESDNYSEKNHGLVSRLKLMTFRVFGQSSCCLSLCLNENNQTNEKHKSNLDLSEEDERQYIDRSYKEESKYKNPLEEQNELDLITEFNNLCSGVTVMCNEETGFNETYRKTDKLKESQSISQKKYYSSLNNINEFYSKVGNRLGNS